MITQLVYSSKATFDTQTDAGSEHIAEILATARQKNKSSEITGFLLIGHGWFLQMLEGPAQAVSQLFRTLLNDPRHTAIALIDTRFAVARAFPDWSMGVSKETQIDIAPSDLLGEASATSPIASTLDRVIALAQSHGAEIGHP